MDISMQATMEYATRCAGCLRGDAIKASILMIFQLQRWVTRYKTIKLLTLDFWDVLTMNYDVSSYCTPEEDINLEIYG